MFRAFVAVALLALTGCASMVTGTSQEIKVTTAPPGAQCTLTRQGIEVGRVISTPASLMVSKDSHPISVACSKEGYQTGRQLLAAGFEAMTLGNVLVGGLIGMTIDAADGAADEYPDAKITLLAGSDAGASVAAATAAQPTSAQPASSATAVNWPQGSDDEPKVNCALTDGSVVSITASQCFDKRGRLLQGTAQHYEN